MIESKYLKNDVKNIQRLLAIPTLQKFETESLGRLLKLSKIRRYDSNECIIREGDQDPWLYFLLSGRVRVTKEGVELFKINTIGDLFGEMRIVDSSSRSASVYAEVPTACLAINTSGKKGFGIADSGDRDVEFLLLLYRIFAEFVSTRLRITNEELVIAKRKIEELKQNK
ncbi:MAG: cyclic nucleotide-binding domain-containing protein [Desulfobacterales bacterium]|nr:MAG: cyclic nucleotide-binding domain-containing protein [Desulfobacterales bacterium]